MPTEDVAGVIAALRDNDLTKFETLIASVSDDDASNGLWRAVAAVHGTSFNLFERLTSWSSTGASAGLRRLLRAVGHVSSIARGDGVALLQFAQQVEPSFHHRVAEQLTPHIKAQPALGEELGESIGRGEVAAEGAIRVWAGSFWAGAPQEASAYALTLLGEAPAAVPVLAILLQHAPTRASAAISALIPHEAAISDALLRAVPVLQSDAWNALAIVADFSPAAGAALCEAVSKGDALAVAAVSNWLHTVSGPTVGASCMSLEELIRSLLAQAVVNSDVRVGVDSALASMLYRPSLRAAVLACVGELRNVDAPVAEYFDSTFAAVADHPADYTKLLTEWLVDERAAFQAIRSLLSKCAAQQAPAGLDVSAFASAPPARRLAAARRLLGLTFHGPTLCLFIASIAETPLLRPDGLSLAAQMLNEAFCEYPDSTEQFLKSRTRPSARKEPFAHVYRGVYANALRWRRVLMRLPELNELKPTDAQRHALRAMMQRMQREVLRAAREASVFASLFRNVHIAQGQQFASHTGFGPPQVTAMKAASHEVELPSSELADPVGGVLWRARMLANAR